MRVTVNKDKCMGCGVCETDAPEVFSLDQESHAIVLLDEVPDRFADAVRQAVDDCPEQAIEVA